MKVSGLGAVEQNNLNRSVASLAERGWLADCSQALSDRLFEIGQPMRYVAGEALFRCNEKAKGIYGISNGSVSIGVPADDGQEVVIYHTGKWFWVGDLELLANGPRIASVVAAGPTDCLFLPIGQVRQLVKDQPDFLHEFYRMSYQNGRMIMRALANMTVPGSAKRVALRLLQYHQASCSEGDWIMISQTQLAQTTALSPATLQRVIKRLVAMDILEVGYGKLRILDLERLSGLLEA